MSRLETVRIQRQTQLRYLQGVGVGSRGVGVVLLLLVLGVRVGTDNVGQGGLENADFQALKMQLSDKHDDSQKHFTFSPKPALKQDSPTSTSKQAIFASFVDLTKPLPPKPRPVIKTQLQLTSNQQSTSPNIQLFESPEQPRNLHQPNQKAYPEWKQQQQQQVQQIEVAEQRSVVPTGIVFVLTLVMALTSGLGAVPFYFMQNMSEKWAGVCNAMACGVMLAASFDLVHEGESYGPELVILGLILGAWFIRSIQQYLEQYEDVRFESLKGTSARKVLLVVGIMAAHALGEGSGVGVSFCGKRGWAQGILVTFAIGVHNIPEGMAVATVMVAKGCTPNQALLWSTLTSMPQALLAVPSYIFVDAFKACLPVALGFAAGCMVWMVFAELLPDAVKDAGAASAATTATFSGACMEGFRMMLATLERPNGTLASPVQGDIYVVLPTLASIFPVWIPPIFISVLVANFLSSLGPSLLESSVAVQTTLGSMSFLYLILFSQYQSIFTTLIFFAIGGLLVIAFWHNQVSKLNEGFSRNSSWGKLSDDVEQGNENGSVDSHSNNGSAGSWAVVQNHLQDGVGIVKIEDKQRNGGLQLGVKKEENLIQMQKLNDAFGKEFQWFKVSQKHVAPASGFWQSGLTVQIAALTSFLAFIAYEVSQGWLMAQVAVSAPFDTGTQIMIPACFKAIPIGLAAAGLAPFILGEGQYNMVIMAIMLGAVSPLMASLSILRYPLGESTPEEVAFDPNNWITKSLAAGSGAMMVSGLWGLWPLLQLMNLQVRYVGLILGLFATLLIQSVLELLCLGTPYCMRVQ